MRKYTLVLQFILFSLPVFAQSKSGITGQPDTSYTNYSAYQHSIKTHPNISAVPELKSKKVKESRNLVYCQCGERSLALDAFFPKKGNKKGRPAIMIIHGGGWRSGNRTQHHPLAQHLAAKGYVCFTPEYRLSTEALYPAAVHDLKAAISWMKKNAGEYNIDTTKITVLGFSAGGELAAFLGVTGNQPPFEDAACNMGYGTTVDAIVDLDGTLSFVHPESGEGDDSRSTSAATYWFGYGKKDNTPLWIEASPLTHVSKSTPPTLFINSSIDRMHAGRDDFRKVLSENGIYSEVQTFADAPHSFPQFNPWFEPTVTYIDTFLKKVFNDKKAF